MQRLCLSAATVALALSTDDSRASVARRLGVNETTLRNWVAGDAAQKVAVTSREHRCVQCAGSGSRRAIIPTVTSPSIERGLAALRDGDPAAARRAFEAAVAVSETGAALEGLAEALYLEREYSASADAVRARLRGLPQGRRPDGGGPGGALGGVDHRQRPRRLGGAERLVRSGSHDPGGSGRRPARAGLGPDHPVALGAGPAVAGGDTARRDRRRPSLRRSRYRVRGARISRRTTTS